MKKKEIVKKKSLSKKKKLLIILSVFVFIWLVSSIYHFYKPVPKGVDYEGEIHLVSDLDIEFLYDLAYYDNDTRLIEQEIFKEIFDLINNSNDFILIDFFLFNNDYTHMGDFINLSSDLTDLLVEKKNANNEVNINFVTDPINNFYGSYEANHLKRLKEAEINLVVTDLTKLRDSNPFYSGFWRAYLQWFGTSGRGFIPHLLGNEEYKVTFRSILSLMNTKANHRKVVVADNEGEFYSIITSANPHDASSFHSNIAFKIKGDIALDLIKSEAAVYDFSGGDINLEALVIKDNENYEKNASVQLLTEKSIKRNLLSDIDSTQEGDEIEIAMFYLSDRDIINSLISASNRNVSIRIVLDPNKDAFAREKNGIPNRQVAYELYKKSEGKIQLRWYNTKGEQFHSKMVVIRKEGEVIIYGGSANLTRRNLDNFNLETDVRIVVLDESFVSNELKRYFNRIWFNKDYEYTLDLMEDYFEDSIIKYWVYRFQEFSGLSSF